MGKKKQKRPELLAAQGALREARLSAGEYDGRRRGRLIIPKRNRERYRDPGRHDRY